MHSRKCVNGFFAAPAAENVCCWLGPSFDRGSTDVHCKPAGGSPGDRKQHTATHTQPHTHTATQPHTQPHTMTTCQVCRPRYNSVLTRTTSEGIVARVRCVHAFNPAALWEVALEVVGVHIKLTDVAFMPKLQHTPVELRHLQHTRCVGLQDSRPAHSMAARVGRHSRTNSRPPRRNSPVLASTGFPAVPHVHASVGCNEVGVHAVVAVADAQHGAATGGRG